MVSVIIPTLNSKGLIRDQLQSLAQQSFKGEWEIVVADNGCTDDTSEIVKQFSEILPNIRMIDARARRGTSAARNIGISAAKGDIILLCDHDDEVSTTWVEEMITGINQYDIVGASANKEKLNTQGMRNYTTHVPLSIEFVSGSSMGFHRKLWQRLGGFNESLLDGGEDVDFCWRALDEGLSVGSVSTAVFYPRSRNDLAGAFRQAKRAGRGTVQLYSMWGNALVKRRSLTALLSEIGWLVTRLPILPLSRAHRFRWVYKVGLCCGLLLGMFRYRQFVF